MTVRVDFHTHTLASDGALAPSALVARAVEAGISRLAITDHDTLAGYLTARDACPDGLDLVSGVELSCLWSGVGIHVLGLGVDVESPDLQAGLATLAEAREARALEIAARLERRGFAGAWEGARVEAAGSQLGRPHFARWLVRAGHLPDEATAFRRYLGAGKVGDVKTGWPTLAEACRWVCAASGIAVLAHPLQYRLTRMKLRRLLTAFVDAGGQGLEVLSGRQDAAQVGELKRLAGDFGLCASAGSDFHRDSPYGPQLGVESRVLEGVPNIMDHLDAVSSP
jgi:hypothetical protein